MIEAAQSKAEIEAPEVGTCDPNSKALTIVMSQNKEMKDEFLAKQAALQNKYAKDNVALENVINVNHAFDVGGRVLDPTNEKDKEYIEKHKYKAQKQENNNNNNNCHGNKNDNNNNNGAAPMVVHALSKKIEYNKTEFKEFETMVVNSDNIDNNGTDLYGNTALHKVIQWSFSESKYIEYVILLLNENNMSKDGINKLDKSEGKTAFHMLISTYLESLEQIENYKKTHPDFVAPSLENFEKMIQQMLDCVNVDRNVKNKNGKSVFELVQEKKQFVPQHILKLFT